MSSRLFLTAGAVGFIGLFSFIDLDKPIIGNVVGTNPRTEEEFKKELVGNEGEIPKFFHNLEDFCLGFEVNSNPKKSDTGKLNREISKLKKQKRVVISVELDQQD